MTKWTLDGRINFTRMKVKEAEQFEAEFRRLNDILGREKGIRTGMEERGIVR